MVKMFIIFKILKQNYFDGLTKLFSDLVSSKILDPSAKSLFPYANYTFGTCRRAERSTIFAGYRPEK